MPAFIFGLGSIEFLVAALVILFIDTDPKNAVVLGYSPQRLLIFLLALLPAISLLILAIRADREKISFRIENVYAGNAALWTYISIVLGTAGFITLIAPPDLFGQFGSYFERLRPLLVVAAFFPLQLLIIQLIRNRQPVDRSLRRYWLISLGLLLLLTAVIAFSKLGITPDTHHWNVAAMPVSSLQFAGLMLAAFISMGVIRAIKNYLPNQYEGGFDLIIVITIYLLTVVVWGQTPMVKHFFSVRPQPPYEQPFPYSDAQIHDLGALSILKGWGINFGEYTDKPLYMVSLAALHVVAGLDYNLLVQLQIWFLALIPPFLYLFGKIFHSRFFGILISSLILIRERNAIVLSHLVASVNPRLLMTEIITLMGLILFAWLIFLWLKKHREDPWIGMLAGGTLGFLTLIRTNPVVFLPAAPFFALPALWTDKRKWLLQVAAFMLGFAMLVTPWIMTGRNAAGESYFFLKFLDVFNTRYSPGSLELQAEPRVASSGGFLLATFNPAFAVHLGREASAKWFEAGTFPGFVLNHFLHNLVGAFLALPDSVFPSDQNLQALVQRPYWQEGEQWTGKLEPGRIPFILLNLSVLAAGLAWSWKCWRWAGMVPLMVFLVYDLSLGLARNSGSRYLVPMDWVVFFYFGVGVVFLLGRLSESFSKTIEAAPLEEGDIRPFTGQPAQKRYYTEVVALILAGASLIPLADNLFPAQPSFCEDVSIQSVVLPFVEQAPIQEMTWAKGECFIRCWKKADCHLHCLLAAGQSHCMPGPLMAALKMDSWSLLAGTLQVRRLKRMSSSLLIHRAKACGWCGRMNHDRPRDVLQL